MRLILQKLLVATSWFGVAVMFLLIFGVAGLLEYTNKYLQDRFQAIAQPKLDGGLLIVEYDKQAARQEHPDLDSGAKLPKRKRETLGRVLDTLLKLEAKVVAIDLLLDDPPDSSDDSSQILEYSNRPNIIHSIEFGNIEEKMDRAPYDSSIGKFTFSMDLKPQFDSWLFAAEPHGPYLKLEQAAVNLAHINYWPHEIDKKVRRVPVIVDYNKRYHIPSLALAALSKYLVVDSVRVTNDRILFYESGSSECKVLAFDKRGRASVRFLKASTLRRPKQWLRYTDLNKISSVDDASMVRGKLVLIGATERKYEDKHETPIGDGYPGLYVHASLINSVLQGSVLRENDWVAMPIFLLVGMPFFIFLRRQSAHLQFRNGIFLLILIVSGMMISAYITFLSGWIWDVAFPVYGMGNLFVVAVAEGKIANLKYERAEKRMAGLVDHVNKFGADGAISQSEDNLAQKQVVHPLPQHKKVFISYNHGDIVVAMRLKAALKEANVAVTIDTETMKAGEDIKKFIQKAVASTDVTLSVVSNESLLSGWVGLETVNTFYYAEFQEAKKFIACFIDDDFFKRDFTLKAIEKIDEDIRDIESVMVKHAEKKVDTGDLNAEKTRLYDLRNNLNKIIGKLRDSACINIRGDQFEANLEKIVESIRN